MIELVVVVVLVVLIGIGYYLIEKTYDFDILGIGLVVTGIFFLFLHVIGLSLTTYGYLQFETQVQITQQTINSARENNNTIELAAISQSVVGMNQQIADKKFDNKTLILDMYIDDRIDTLSYIK